MYKIAKLNNYTKNKNKLNIDNKTQDKLFYSFTSRNNNAFP